MVDRLRDLRPIDISGGSTRAFDPYVIDIDLIIRPGGPKLPSRLAIRPDDLVVLEVSWSGLDLETIGGEPALTRNKNGVGYLILTFAPQNLAEQAFYQDSAFPDAESPKPPEAGPAPAPIDHRLSDDSRLVFRVPKGTTVPLNLVEVLEAAGSLEMSVPANALPRERKISAVLVSASDLLADSVAIRGTQSVIERLAVAGRLREHVRGSGPLMAESVPALEMVIAPHQRVTPDTRAMVSVRGELVSEPPRSAIESVITEVIRLRPRPAMPSSTQTAIESPYRLLISPSKLGGWAHAKGVVEHDGRTELWHTRLGTRTEDDDGHTVVDEDSAFQRVVRAVWARGMSEPSIHSSPPPPYDKPGPDSPFRMALDARDRHNIVHLSSNFGIIEGSKRYTPEPVVVNRLMLTSLGSWMDFEGKWPQPPGGLSLAEWLHRATVGRDHYVRVVYQGFVLPFGHRVTLVKETERKFASDQPDRDWGKTDNPAYLIQRMFIVVEEQEKTFGGNKTFDGGKKFANAMPFKSVRIVDRQTPDLDQPKDSEFDSMGTLGFWPMVGKQPFLFRMVATDGEGNQVTLAAPLLFVDKTVDENQAKLTKALVAYGNGTGIPGQPAKVTFRGQRVAYAPAKGVDDTTFETNFVTFAASIPQGQSFTAGTKGPRFHPRVGQAELVVPALRQIAGGNNPLTVNYDTTFLQHGFAVAAANPNKGELLFRSLPLPLALHQNSDRSGGLASPSMKISGISRSLGAVAGDAEKILKGEFDPLSFFAGMTANLFGVIPLSAVIKKVDFPSALTKVPRFVGKTLDQVESFLDDLARLEQTLKGHAALWDEVKVEVAAVAAEIHKLFKAAPADLSTALNQLSGKVTSLQGQLPGPLPVAAVNEVKAVLARVEKTLDDIDELVELVDKLVKGIEIPRSLSTRFEWKPALNKWPNATNPIFDPQSDSLVLVVEARGSVDQGGDFTVSASLEDFWLRMIAPAKFLSIHFQKIQLQVEAGKKPEIDVVMGDIVFEGVLSFVETLRNLIPLDAFSDPPAVQVDSAGIKAEMTVGLPNLSVGVFSLENLSLGGGFAVPFVGDPLSVYFRFCERENPALVSVSLFAGGFFFGITLTPQGVKILEAAIEFGANVSMNFGVASGGVSVMAGLYFKLESNDATLTGYFRARGNVRALGIVTVSIELYLEMSYETATGKCVGRAKLSISISLFLFEATITISCEKKFAGSGSDPTFLQAMGPYRLDSSDPTSPLVEPWKEYCAAFA